MMPVFTFLLVLMAWLLTAALRQYALKRQVLDIPNERSSHKVPTPRGGGVAVVIGYLSALSALWFSDVLMPLSAAALLTGGILIAMIGFLDDHGHVNAKWRLLVHFTGASAVVYAAGGLPVLSFGGLAVDFGWFGYLLATVAIVWILNLFNFMDGIDGIAGLEAVSVCVVMALLLHFRLPGNPLTWLAIMLAAATLGFLLWNLPPARIFMGDAGSGFIGFQLGALSLLSAQLDSRLLWCWLIMLGVFVVDATFTLISRLWQGFKVYEAHRTHAYQHAAMQAGRHAPVSYSVLAINLGWLAPWACSVLWLEVDGIVALVMAYLPLLWLTWRFRAGRNI